MATAYIDVRKEPGIDNIPSPTATSTVTNKVRVAWDSSCSRQDVHRTLTEIAEAILDKERIALAGAFTD